MAQFHGWARFGYRTIIMGYLVLLVQAFTPPKATFNGPGRGVENSHSFNALAALRSPEEKFVD
jgi:hypothetical protein